jgi:hypothetical protein
MMLLTLAPPVPRSTKLQADQRRDSQREATAKPRAALVFNQALENSQLAGWVASDAGLRRAAQRYYLAAMRAADAGGDRPLAAQAISSLAYQAASGDDARTAVVLARSAYEGARGARHGMGLTSE